MRGGVAKLPLALVLVLTLGGCSGGSGSSESAGASTGASAAPSGSSSVSVPSISEEDLRRQLSPAVDKFRTHFQAYLSAYGQYNGMDVSQMTWEEAADLSLTKQAVLEGRLDKLSAEGDQLYPLIDAAIYYGAINEVVSGDVDPADVRDYFTVVGDWIDSSRDGFAATDECFKQPYQQGLACLDAFAASAQYQDGAQLTQRLNELQTKLFG
jgi:hypothetical protein